MCLLCCIGDLAEILQLNDLCDRLGLDTITVGNIAALAIEAVQRAGQERDILPKQMFREPLNNGQDAITVEELDFMLNEYDKLRGWDNQGRPSTN